LAEFNASASECYRGAGMTKEQASALQGVFSAQLSMEAPKKAAETARQMMLQSSSISVSKVTAGVGVGRGVRGFPRARRAAPSGP